MYLIRKKMEALKRTQYLLPVEYRVDKKPRPEGTIIHVDFEVHPTLESTQRERNENGALLDPSGVGSLTKRYIKPASDQKTVDNWLDEALADDPEFEAVQV